jgi:hypothetical protein
MAYLANGLIEFLQSTLTERVRRSPPSGSDSAFDASGRGFVKFLTLFFEFFNELIAFIDGRFDILDQILFIRSKYASLQCSVKKLERAQETFKFLYRSNHVSVLALV